MKPELVVGIILSVAGLVAGVVGYYSFDPHNWAVTAIGGGLFFIGLAVIRR